MTPLPSAIRGQVRALVASLNIALRADVARARDALRAMLGDLQLIEDDGSVYAECDNAAERLLLAVGGVSMGRVAGAGFEPVTFRLRACCSRRLRARTLQSAAGRLRPRSGKNLMGLGAMSRGGLQVRAPVVPLASSTSEFGLKNGITPAGPILPARPADIFSNDNSGRATPRA